MEVEDRPCASGASAMGVRVVVWEGCEDETSSSGERREVKLLVRGAGKEEREIRVARGAEAREARGRFLWEARGGGWVWAVEAVAAMGPAVAARGSTERGSGAVGVVGGGCRSVCRRALATETKRWGNARERRGVRARDGFG